MIFKHYIFLVVYFYLGNFQFITTAYAGLDSEEPCISTSKLDGNSYKQIATGQISVRENCNPELKTETYPADEVASEQSHEAISLDPVTVLNCTQN